MARIERAPVREQLGLPRVAGLRLQVGADSPCIVESRSMKLYLNGFAQTRFDSPEAVHDVLANDLGEAFGAPVAVALLASNRRRVAQERNAP